MRHSFLLLISVMFCACFAQHVMGQEYSPYYYDIGSPDVTDIYVDPLTGSDQNEGSSRSNPLRTEQAAWGKIPSGQSLSTGYRINLLPGVYSIDQLVNFYEDKHGTAQHPIIITAADGQNTVRWSFGINAKNCSYLYFINFEINTPGADPLHIELGDHILVRGMLLDGGSDAIGSNGEVIDGREVAHEGIKINQSQNIYIENTNVSGADDNAIDFVAVQYGHVVANKIHHSGDWCMYAKGGSAQLRIEGNEFKNCGTGGFTAGQGTGFEFMVAPWIHYEAYDIKFINNIIHHTAGAAVGVNGGYNILMAYNTAYETGMRDHVVEAGSFGQRSCDGDQEKVANCVTYNSAGGWGPTQITTGSDDVTPGARDPQPIPNKNVLIVNNIFYNSSISSPQHFVVYAPRSPAGGTNITSPAVTDDNLVIKGNLIWNGNVDTGLGVGESGRGCQDSNPTCNVAQLRADNLINALEPQFLNAAGLDFRPMQGGNLFNAGAVSLSNFSGGDRPSSPQPPAGNLLNQVAQDLSGNARSGTSPAGAFSSSNSALNHDPASGSDLPDDSMPGTAPQVGKIDAKCSRVKCTVKATVSGSVSNVSASLRGKGVKKSANLSLNQGRYSAAISYKKVAKGVRVTVSVTASGTAGSDIARKVVVTK